jgi:hypothetical protein
MGQRPDLHPSGRAPWRAPRRLWLCGTDRRVTPRSTVNEGILMRSLRATVVFLATAGALAAGLAPASASAGSAEAYSCSAGYFCMYSDWNGTGSRCQYSQRVSNTADLCSFIRAGSNVRSVYNRNSRTATYYTRTNYESRIGSTPSGGRGSLQGNYQIRSISF